MSWKGLSSASTAHPPEGWECKPDARGTIFAGRGSSSPLWTVEDGRWWKTNAIPPLLLLSLIWTVHSSGNSPILGSKGWLLSGPQTLSVPFWGLSDQNEPPALSPQVTPTLEVMCRHVRRVSVYTGPRSPKETALDQLDPPGPAAVVPSSLPANYASVTESLLCPQRDPQKPSTSGKARAEQSVRSYLSLVKINAATGIPCTSPLEVK